jgi:AraC-like DNA-binding protein
MSEHFASAKDGADPENCRKGRAGSRRIADLRVRTNLGSLRCAFISVEGASPGYYEHPPFDGVSVYLAKSRAVGQVDVGEGFFDMAVQAGDFLVGVPGSGAKHVSYRGGHGMQIILSARAMRVAAETRNAPVWDFRRLHAAFHQDRTIYDLAMEIARVCTPLRKPDPLHADTLVLTLLETLARFSYTCDRRHRETSPLDARIVATIDEYISEHLAEEITLEALAGLAEMPRTRFLKAFRNAVGKTPYQFLLLKRLEAVRAMVMDSNSSIADIAFACGFSSQQHLTGLFSSRFGISPSAFRKQVIGREIVEWRSLKREKHEEAKAASVRDNL